MNGSESHPHSLELPRDERGLATGARAVRRIQELLCAFVEDKLRSSGADGFVVVLDGSVGSTVTAAMAVEATDADRVLGMVMPARMGDEASARAAEAVASMLSVDYHRLHLQPLLSAFQRVIGATGEPADDLVAMGNVCQRLRMTCLYYVANTTGRLVLGSIDRTQRLLGRMTKHGENGVDIAPLSDIYRTEVRALAEGLSVPDEILERRHRPGDYAGVDDAGRLGIEPRTLDSLLHFLVEEGERPAAVADRLGVDIDLVQSVQRWCAESRHKRHPPLKPSFDL